MQEWIWPYFIYMRSELWRSTTQSVLEYFSILRVGVRIGIDLFKQFKNHFNYINFSNKTNDQQDG